MNAIGLALASLRRCKWVRCVEISSEGREAFVAAAAQLSQNGNADAPCSRLDYIVAAAGDNPAAHLAGVSFYLVHFSSTGSSAPKRNARACCAAYGKRFFFCFSQFIYRTCGSCARGQAGSRFCSQANICVRSLAGPDDALLLNHGRLICQIAFGSTFSADI